MSAALDLSCAPYRRRSRSLLRKLLPLAACRPHHRWPPTCSPLQIQVRLCIKRRCRRNLSMIHHSIAHCISFQQHESGPLQGPEGRNGWKPLRPEAAPVDGEGTASPCQSGAAAQLCTSPLGGTSMKAFACSIAGAYFTGEGALIPQPSQDVRVPVSPDLQLRRRHRNASDLGV